MTTCRIRIRHHAHDLAGADVRLTPSTPAGLGGAEIGLEVPDAEHGEDTTTFQGFENDIQPATTSAQHNAAQRFSQEYDFIFLLKGPPRWPARSPERSSRVPFEGPVARGRPVLFRRSITSGAPSGRFSRRGCRWRCVASSTKAGPE